VWVKTDAAPSALRERINRYLPEGMTVTELVELATDSPSLASSLKGFRYVASLPDDPDAGALAALEEKVSAFLSAKEFPIARNIGERTVIRDIRPLVVSLGLSRPDRRIFMDLRFSNEGSVRPEDILVRVLGLDPGLPAAMNLTKTATFFVDK